MLSPIIRSFACILTFAGILWGGQAEGWGAEPPSAHAGEETSNHNQIVMSGDTIAFWVVEEQGRQETVTVADNGMIQIRHAGAVKAHGRTCRELSKAIGRELAAHAKSSSESSFFKKATVGVTIAAFNEVRLGPGGPPPAFSVCVVGKVARQGRYEIPAQGMTVSAILHQAGGQVSSNPVPSITIVRRTPQGNKVILVNSHAVLVQNSRNHDLFLRSGDAMIVDKIKLP